MVEYPSDWKVKTLGEVADVEWGDTSTTKAKYVQIGFNAYSASGKDGFLDYYDYDRIGVVLSAIGACCGKSWIAEGRWSCIKNTIRYFGYENIADTRFLHVLLTEEKWPRMGAAQPFISLGAARSVKIPLPPLPEQKRIAKVLDDVDRLIENLGKRIAKKRLIKKGIAQELLTGKKRLSGFEGAWKTVKLGESYILIMGQSPESANYNTKGDGLPLIQGNADMIGRCSIIRIYTSQVTKICEAGDIILSVRAPVGAVGKARVKSCLGRGVCAIKAENDFLYQYLIFVEDRWSSLSTGSTFDSINSDQLSRVEIPQPPLPEQWAIAKVLSDMDEEIANLEARQAKLKLVKKGMLQDLLTGKVRLK